MKKICSLQWRMSMEMNGDSKNGVLVIAPLECNMEEVVMHLSEQGLIVAEEELAYIKQAGGAMELVQLGANVREDALTRIREHVEAGGIRRVIVIGRVGCKYYQKYLPGHGNGPEDHAVDVEMAAEIIRAVFPVIALSFVTLLGGPRNTLLAMESSCSFRGNGS